MSTPAMQRRAFLLVLGLAALAPPAQAAEGRSYTGLGAFDALEISGAADLRLQQGAADEVFVEGDDSVQKQVDLRVRGGVLRIDTAGGWKFWSARRPQIVVTVRQLSRLLISGAGSVHAPGPLQAGRLALSISGAGKLRFDQISAEQVSLGVSGSGDADLAGMTRELSVSVSGRGELQAENLASRSARVAIAGVGEVRLWAIEQLTVSVSGIGRVEYWGAPALRRSSSGMATIVPRGDKPAPAVPS